MLASFLCLVGSVATAAFASPLAKGYGQPHPRVDTEYSQLISVSAIDDCPGYTAFNVVKTDSSLTADLTLAGTACNAYGKDLDALKLLVEYQTSEPALISSTFLHVSKCNTNKSD
jgi:alpha-glucosidase